MGQRTLDSIWSADGEYSKDLLQVKDSDHEECSEKELTTRRKKRMCTAQILRLRCTFPPQSHLLHSARLHIYSKMTLFSHPRMDSFVHQSLYVYGRDAIATTCAFSHNSATLASATNGGLMYSLPGTEGVPLSIEKMYKGETYDRGNAIFDLKWSNDDQKIALGTSATQAFILDVTKGCTTAELRGHTRSQKAVRWCNSQNDLLASGDRDGTVCVWDMRQPSHFERLPASRIEAAHGARSTPVAVTDILFPDENTLYSSGNSNAWDLRMMRLDYTEATIPHNTSPHNPISMEVRPRGIVSMQDLDYGRILVLSRDSKIYVYDRETLKPEAVCVTDEALRVNSPFASMAVSRCHCWAAAGGMYGVVVVFNVEKLGSLCAQRRRPKPNRLEVNHGEVNGISWSQNALATSSDDGTVKVWRTGAR